MEDEANSEGGGKTYGIISSKTLTVLLQCLFQFDEVAVSVCSNDYMIALIFLVAVTFRYDLHLGTSEVIGDHDDLSTCIGYSDETCKQNHHLLLLSF